MPSLSVGPERESEIVSELAAQMEQAYADALSGGASASEASAPAEEQFRNWEELAHEIERAERRGRPRLLAGTWHDARFAGRYLLRNPAFAAVAVLTLAFGIGASVAVFSLVDALVLRSLPYRDAGRLMAVETRRAQQPELEPWTSPPDFFDLRERSRAFSELAAIDPLWSVVLTGQGDAQQLTALYTSANFFPLLGVKAELGRTFSPARGCPRRAARGGDAVARVLAAPIRRTARGSRPEACDGQQCLQRDRRAARGFSL